MTPQDPIAEADDESCVAIIGMSGRFPDANTLEQFWRNLRDGVDSVRALSDEELRQAGVDETDAGTRAGAVGEQATDLHPVGQRVASGEDEPHGAQENVARTSGTVEDCRDRVPPSEVLSLAETPPRERDAYYLTTRKQLFKLFVEDHGHFAGFAARHERISFVCLLKWKSIRDEVLGMNSPADNAFHKIFH